MEGGDKCRKYGMGNFLLLLLLLLPLRTPPLPPAHFSAWRPISQPRGPNPGLEAQIPTSRPKSPPQGPNSSLKGFGLQDWDLGLKAGIWALRLRYGPRGWGGGGGQRKRRRMRRRRRKFPFNFYPNLLKQGTGTADHLTLLRLFLRRFPLFMFSSSFFSSVVYFKRLSGLKVTMNGLFSLINTKIFMSHGRSHVNWSVSRSVVKRKPMF